VLLCAAGGRTRTPQAAQNSAAKAPAGLAGELQTLAQALRQQDSELRYTNLAEFARAHAASDLGARAAIALGYRDWTRKRYPQALAWLERGLKDPVLEQFALYWHALALRDSGRNTEALAEFETHLARFPDSVMAGQGVRALAEVALAANQPKRALAALDAFPGATGSPALLLLRARAREAIGARQQAVPDYASLYYDHPLADEAAAAGKRLEALRTELPPRALEVELERRLARAAALFGARQWRAAQAEYTSLLPQLSGAEAQRGRLRLAQCRAELTRAAKPLESLSLADEDLDAERLYLLSQFYRGRRDEAAMLRAVERAAARAPRSRWAEEALFAAGNFFWVKLDRARAAEFYRRQLETFSAGANALDAGWRVAWTAYLEREEGAAALLEAHLRKFPASKYIVNTLYWLGRSAERAGQQALARAYYFKLKERFPQTYFGLQAAGRLKELGEAPRAEAPLVALITEPQPLPELDAPIPPLAADRWKRALALHSIAFDSSAELELRAAYATTRAPRLMFEAARAALRAERIPQAVTAARQSFPQIESRRWEDVPPEVWSTLYPLAYGSHIEKYAARTGLDSGLVAGLIRQESLFQTAAVSRRGACGLMQVLPSTGRRLARQEKIGYSRARLFDPEYNLRLGTAHLRKVLDELGSLEAALAAYNAGEHRVVAWQAERRFAEPGEFVESIPLTETREYVQIVARNAEIYRRLYARNISAGQ
jgi:soluble lytic murein transglycosylase